MDFRFNSLLARLLIGTCIPLILFIAVVVVAIVSISRLREALRLERHSREVLTRLHQTEVDLERMRVELRGIIIEMPDASAKDLAAIRDQFRSRVAKLREQVGDNHDQVERLDRLAETEVKWERVANEILPHLERRPGQTREEMMRLIREQFGRSLPIAEEMQDEIRQLIEAEDVRLARRRERSASETWQSIWLIAVTAGVALVLALVVSLRMARGITLPIDRLREAAGQLVGGRFQVVPPSGPTEVEELTVRFNQMGMTLSERTSSLEEQKDRYQQYLGATSHILWATDAAGRVAADLPGWRAYTGQTVEQVRGDGWLNAVHPEDRARTEAVWRQSVETRRPYEQECRLRGTSGEYRYFWCRGVPLPNPDGSVREWIGTCTDITERKKEAALARAKEAAEASNRAKSEFLAKMSHELRTPLNAVIGMSKMLVTQRFGSLNAKQADYLGDITHAGEHLLALINDILDLAKVEAGRMDLHAEPFAAGEAVTTLVGTLRPLADEKGLSLRCQSLQPDGELRTDQARFKQVLYNLLSNAIKFTPKGGSVTLNCQWVASPECSAAVTSQNEAGAIRVSVTDTGIGIAPEDQEVIWDEFRQVRSNPEMAQQGTGLGLALTRRLVGLLGGMVWLESEPGKGSTFAFVVPRQLPERPASGVPEEDTVADQRSLALVIEDHGPTRKLLLDWLAGEGLATAPAADGVSGLELARRLRPQLIVLDIFLPELDGWHVLTELKSSPETATIPVVIVSVMEDRYPSAGLDVQEFFIKPVEREFFVRRLRELQPGLFERGRPVTALVVDDDPAARKLLRDLLEAEGMTVTDAANGREALEGLSAGLPDVLVLDLLMPEVDGFAVVEAVRSRPEWASLPILVVTAKDLTREDRQRLNGSVGALVSKQRLTPEKLHEQLRRLGLHV